MKLLHLTLLLLLALSDWAHADGGVVLLRASDGEITATLFASPSPLRAGPADFSVLLTDAEDQPLLDREVAVRLREPAEPGESLVPACCRIEAPPSDQRLTAQLGVGGNGLLYEARTRLPKSGEWSLEIRWTDGGDGPGGQVAGVFEVGGPSPPLAAYWPWFLLPVGGAGFLALNAAARAHRKPAA